MPGQATVQTDPNETDTALLLLTENSSHTGDSPTGETGIYMPYKSAMLQSWNKFCFTGGIVEFRARQPRGGGYWPALWLFGNLGRAVYQNSNTGLWPWSYDQCDPDLQLPPTDPAQRISACDDHDLESEGLHAFQGRGATELDVLEGAVTNTGTGSCAAQHPRARAQFLAPFSVTNPSARPQVRRRLGTAVARRAGVLQAALFGSRTKGAGSCTAAQVGLLPNNGWCARELSTAPPSALPQPSPCLASPPASEPRRPPCAGTARRLGPTAPPAAPTLRRSHRAR